MRTVAPWHVATTVTLADRLLAGRVDVDHVWTQPRTFAAVGSVAIREIRGESASAIGLFPWSLVDYDRTCAVFRFCHRTIPLAKLSRQVLCGPPHITIQCTSDPISPPRIRKPRRGVPFATVDIQPQSGDSRSRIRLIDQGPSSNRTTPPSAGLP